jgi:6-pyruvoyl-tetrahydropterin synthase
MDFADLKKAFQPLYDSSTQPLLERHPGAGQSHQRNARGVIWDRLKPALPQLSCVTVHETLHERLPLTHGARPLSAMLATSMLLRRPQCGQSDVAARADG